MFVVTVTFQIKDSALEAFLPLMQENAHRSLADEPDCHRFDICQNPDTPTEIFLYELYTDKAAFEHHLTTPHFAALNAASEGMVIGKTVKTFSLL